MKRPTPAKLARCEIQLCAGSSSQLSAARIPMLERIGETLPVKDRFPLAMLAAVAG